MRIGIGAMAGPFYCFDACAAQSVHPIARQIKKVLSNVLAIDEILQSIWVMISQAFEKLLADFLGNLTDAGAYNRADIFALCP